MPYPRREPRHFCVQAYIESKHCNASRTFATPNGIRDAPALMVEFTSNDVMLDIDHKMIAKERYIKMKFSDILLTDTTNII